MNIKHSWEKDFFIHLDDQTHSFVQSADKSHETQHKDH